MAVYTVHGGHAATGRKYSGAVGLLNESAEDRRVKDAIIKYLKCAGQNVHDATVDSGTSQNDVLKRICEKCNNVNANLNISIHLNSGRNDNTGDGKQGGFEIWAVNYDGIKKEISSRIVNNMTALGFKMHGEPLKTTKGLYFLNHTNKPSLLLEICFVDDKDDFKQYNSVGPDAIGKAIASAVIGYAISTTATTQIKEVSDMAEVQLYDLNGTDAQKWAPVHNSDGSISLKNKSCGKFLDIAGGSKTSGTALQVYKSNGSTAQKFKLKKCSGYTPDFIAPVEIIPVINENLRVDCKSGAKSNGTKLQIYNANNTAAQRWTVIDNGSGYWTIINVNSGKALDVVGGGK